MVRERKNPSSAAVSAASIKGNAGPDYKKAAVIQESRYWLSEPRCRNP
ncbi:YuzL family protein [Bacillus licheniformis]|nr:YuzL family protein [Bacillus licheniformis]